MKLTIKPNNITGVITLPPSKSLTHRYLIAASLAKGTSQIDNMLICDDTLATMNAMEKIGAKFNDNLVTGNNQFHDEIEIDAGESGSTLRFLIPIFATTQHHTRFSGKKTLLKRPLTPYEMIFHQHALLFHKEGADELPLIIKGPLTPGEFRVAGNISSQFISGLMFALPLLSGGSRINITEELESTPYINLTVQALSDFGVRIHFNAEDKSVSIPGNQVYKPQKVIVESDYSQLAFWVAAGLLGDHITIKDVNLESKQGDIAIIDYVKKMGAKIEVLDHDLKIMKSDLIGATLDIKDTPDLAPILMVLGSLAKGKTILQNTSRLKIKESHRGLAMKEELTKLGAQIEVLDNEIIINGCDVLTGDVELSCHDDHRVAMALAIASIKAKGPITLVGYQCVSKSYPKFFEDFRMLGGITNE